MPKVSFTLMPLIKKKAWQMVCLIRVGSVSSTMPLSFRSCKDLRTSLMTDLFLRLAFPVHLSSCSLDTNNPPSDFHTHREMPLQDAELLNVIKQADNRLWNGSLCNTASAKSP